MGEGKFNVNKIPSYSFYVSECVFLVFNFTTVSVTTASLFPECAESAKRESEGIEKGRGWHIHCRRLVPPLVKINSQSPSSNSLSAIRSVEKSNMAEEASLPW